MSVIRKLAFVFFVSAINYAHAQTSGATLQTPPAPPALTGQGTVTIATPPMAQTPPSTREAVRKAVDNAADTILEPGEVRKLGDKVKRAREAQQTPTYPGGKIPKPVSRTIEIEMDPAQQPRMVRLAAATITSMVFSDMEGQPWSIESTSFDPSAFSDGRSSCSAGGQQGASGEQKKQTNILNLLPCDLYSYGNVVVTLKEFSMPIVFMLGAGQADEVDVRLSIRVRGSNPDAKPEIIVSDGAPEHDTAIQAFLDGVPPSAAKPLVVSDNVGQAWQYKGAMYFRSRYEIYAPAFWSHAGSADGLHVYKFKSVQPALTISRKNRPDTITISGY